MDDMRNDPEAMRVWETVIAMNRLWTEKGEPEKLDRYFHPQMVAICANERERRVGKAACLEGWKGFCDRAREIKLTERDPLVRIHCDGCAAIVTYNYDCSFKMNGVLVETRGRDMFTLVKEKGEWRVVADHFSATP